MKDHWPFLSHRSGLTLRITRLQLLVNVNFGIIHTSPCAITMGKDNDRPIFDATAGKQCKIGMYECTVHNDHIACTCQAYHCDNVCKHSLVVANKAGILREHLGFVTGSHLHRNPLRSGLNDTAPEASGKKGGRNKNMWREPRRATPTQTHVLPPRPFSEVHHNDNPLKVVFLDDFPKAVSCRQCGVHFPLQNKMVPYYIVLSHEEKWLYPDPENPRNKLPSCHMTV